MEIWVLGSGCVPCEKLALQVYRVLQELGLKDPVVRIEREAVVDYLLPGVRAPGLIINEELVWAGGPPPSEEELKAWIWLAFQREQLRKAG